MTENNSTPNPVSYDITIVLVCEGVRINSSFSYQDKEKAQEAFDSMRFGHGSTSIIEITTPDDGVVAFLAAYLVVFQMEPMYA